MAAFFFGHLNGTFKKKIFIYSFKRTTDKHLHIILKPPKEKEEQKKIVYKKNNGNDMMIRRNLREIRVDF